MGRVLKVPTGYIAVLEEGTTKACEVVVVQDYGKSANIKSDFLGITEPKILMDNDIELMPYEEKLVITISTQHGCSMGCKFCDVPLVGVGRNITSRLLDLQFETGLRLANTQKTKRLNLHYARMGEPTFNFEVLRHAIRVPGILHEMGFEADVFHPVVSTMMPKKNHKLMPFLHAWARIKNELFDGDAGLQFSINSTDDEQRHFLFGESAHNLEDIAESLHELPDPKGRKYTLNFALSNDTIINGARLAKLFPPSKFMVKLTPMHINNAVTENGLVLPNGYSNYTPYEDAEKSCIDAGFDTLVFIPHPLEDEGMITCGNAVLSGRLPKTI